MRAEWSKKVLAQSGKTVVVEGNQYFPPESLRKDFFKPSVTTTKCPWKGTAHYYGCKFWSTQQYIKNG